ncbi:MAG: hypothetical protein MR529_04525 [Cuneatibacter sp.]|nr:hypothetical protein [Cuneatibacter sp.]
MLVVYLSNRHIRVIVGEPGKKRIQVRKMCEILDSEGCILNGTITDEEGLSHLLAELWEEQKLPRKGVHLLLDTSQFQSRRMEVPVQKPLEMLQFVKREFQESGRQEELVCRYLELPGTEEERARKVRTVFATAAPKEYIRRFLYLFEKLEIEVMDVSCSTEAALQLFGTSEALAGENSIIQLTDEMALINLLFEDGRYCYSSRSRLFAEPATAEYAEETARSVSTILQFAKAQGMEQPVADVRVLGLPGERIGQYEEQVHALQEDIEVQEVTGDDRINWTKEPQDQTAYLILCGALLRPAAEGNLLRQVERDLAGEIKKRQQISGWIPIGVLAVCMAAATAVAVWQYQGLKERLRTVQAYNANATVQEEAASYEEASQRIADHEKLLQELEQLKQVVSQYPRTGASLTEALERNAQGLTLDIYSYDAASGQIGFTAKADSTQDISQFVERLTEDSGISSVTYSGYTQNAEGSWTLKISCVVAGRQEEAR